MSDHSRENPKDSTFAALVREKPKRGRPRHKVARQSVYVALTKVQKQTISGMGKALTHLSRADIPDMAVITLSVRLESVRRAIADRARELPEGITDMESLYFLWDLELPEVDADTKWTSVRLSPQQSVEFGRLQGTFNALFGANRSQVFTLALALLSIQLEDRRTDEHLTSLSDFDIYLRQYYL